MVLGLSRNSDPEQTNSAGIARERAGWSWRSEEHLRVWQFRQCDAPSYSLVPAPCATAHSRVGPKGSDCHSCSDLLQHVVTNTATFQRCLLLYKGPAAFLDFLATASLLFLVTILFFLSHLPHLLSREPWLLLLSPAFAILLYFFPFLTVLFWGHQQTRRPVGLQLRNWCN